MFGWDFDLKSIKSERASLCSLFYEALCAEIISSEILSASFSIPPFCFFFANLSRLFTNLSLTKDSLSSRNSSSSSNRLKAFSCLMNASFLSSLFFSSLIGLTASSSFYFLEMFSEVAIWLADISTVMISWTVGIILRFVLYRKSRTVLTRVNAYLHFFWS